MSLTTDPWVECREVVSGRTLFYHRVTKEVVFDVSPSAIDSAAIKTANAIGRSLCSLSLKSYT